MSAIRVRSRPAADDLAWVGLVLGAAASLAAFEWLAPSLVGPLEAPVGYEPFQIYRILFAPEPLEEARFLIAIAIPIALAIAVILLGSNRPGERRLDLPIIGVQVVALGFVVWTATQQSNDVWLLPDFLYPQILGRAVLVGGAAVGIALTVLLFMDPWLDWPSGRAAAERLGRLRWLPLVVAITVTALWLLPAVVTDRTVGDTFHMRGHIPIQFEDYLAAVNGLTPLVDYVSWYSSLLPLAFAPLLAAFDSSITSFSLLQSALSLAALLCIHATLVLVTERRWGALCLYVPFLAISFVPWHTQGLAIDYSGLYYAAFPNRWLGPFVVIWLLARYLRRGSPRLWVVYCAAGLALFNNFEFGACCLVALIATSAIALDRSAPLSKAIGALIVQAATGLVAAVVLVSAVTLVRAGELPDLSVLTYWTTTFGRQGFGLLPMPAWGLHWAVYFTYVGALLAAAVRFSREPEEGVLTPMLAFSGVFGLTTAQYFAGRSDGTQLIVLFPPWGLALALLTWATVRSLRGAELGPSRRAVVPALAVLLGFGLMVAAIGRFPLPWKQVDRLSHAGPEIYRLSADERFVRSRTDPGESVLIISTPLDHRIAERAGVANVSPWSTNVLFSSREVGRALDNLDHEGGRKLFERFGTIDIPLPEMEEILRQRGFSVVAKDPQTGLRLWERG